MFVLILLNLLLRQNLAELNAQILTIYARHAPTSSSYHESA